MTNQIDAQNFVYDMFISCLYMFRAHGDRVQAWNKRIVKQNFVHQVG
jgi:hypothetical protein